MNSIFTRRNLKVADREVVDRDISDRDISDREVAAPQARSLLDRPTVDRPTVDLPSDDRVSGVQLSNDRSSTNGSTKSQASNAHNPSSRLSEPQLQRLGEILDDLLVQAERGERPDVDAMCAVEPDLAEAIRHYVQSINMLEDVASQLRTPAVELRSPLTIEQRQLGDYRLIREIGRGGMGVVYEAQQISLARRVALKILPFAAVLDARKIARFQNEAQAAASLHHPHIVPVFAVGNDRGTYFYSMQYIDGQSLDFAIAQLQNGQRNSLCALYGQPVEAQLRNATTIVAHNPSGARAPSRARQDSRSLRSQPFDDAQRSAAPPTVDQTSAAAASTIRMPAVGSDQPNTWSANPSSATLIQSRDYVRCIVELGIQAADALHHAHQCGIVHRDIKPSNLLVDSHGHLWITDFGLAQCASLDSLTASGDVMGTLRYMSPEQAAGKSHWVDNRTDIYSLGQTLYELLTLHQAVDGTNRALIMRQIESLEPPTPRRFNAFIPVDLENIILKCLSKQREDRYGTADDLASDLRRFLAGQTPTARKPTLLDRAARWVARNSRAVAIASSLAVVGLIVALSVTSALTTKNRQIVQSQQLAEKHLQIANEAVYRFGHGMLGKLELLPGSQALQRDVAQQSVAYFKQFAQYAHAQSHMHRDVARALMAAADIESQIGHLETAITDCSAASQMLAQLRTTQPDRSELFDDWLQCQNSRACALARLGKRDEAMRIIEAALASLHQSSIKDNESSAITNRAGWTALLHLNLGMFAGELGQSRLAHEQFEAALAQLQQQQPPSPVPSQLRSELSMLMTTALLQAGQVRPIHSRSSPTSATTATSEGIQQQLLEQALKLAEKRMASDDSASIERLSALHDMALCEMALGASASAREQWTSARTSFERAISCLQKLCEQQPATLLFAHDLATASNNLGQMELKLAQIAAAEDAFRESQRQLERLYLSSEDYRIGSSLAGVLHNLAVLEEQRGQRPQAIELLERAIVLQQQAVARAPGDTRCQDFLAEHRAHLARITQP